MNSALEISNYSTWLDDVMTFGHLVVHALIPHGDDLKNTVCRNTLCRGMSTARATLLLWEHGHYSDSWALFRVLLERLFHLYYLASTESWEAFRDWSYVREFERNNRVISNPLFKDIKETQRNKPTPEQRRKYSEIRAKYAGGSMWRRPPAETIAKDMDLKFLYDLDYDYASSYIHPFADDGFYEFMKGCGNELLTTEDELIVVHNTCAITSMLVQEVMNDSSLTWNRQAYEWLETCRGFLVSGDRSYRRGLPTMVAIWEAGTLAAPVSRLSS